MNFDGRNRKMFYQIADLIEFAPELHDQSRYVTLDCNTTSFRKDVIAGYEVTCGTTQCIAGWAMQLDGGYEELLLEMATVLGGCADGEDSLDVDKAAAGILGLNEEEAEHLFHCYDNDIDWPMVLRRIGDGEDVIDTLAIAEGYDVSMGYDC